MMSGLGLHAKGSLMLTILLYDELLVFLLYLAVCRIPPGEDSAVRAKCFRSQRKSEPPHTVKVGNHTASKIYNCENV